jgi:hypothetical protein
LEYAPSYPDHTLVLADLDPELYSLSLGIPADVLGKGEEHARLWLRSGIADSVLLNVPKQKCNS